MSAYTLQDSIHEWQAEEGQTDATMLTGQLEVIAEELRTANLLAVLHGPTMMNLDYEALKIQISERLGLK